MASDTILDGLSARTGEMAALEQVSQRFGQSLTGALDSATASGKSLDAVLGSVGARLASAAVSSVGSGLTSALQSAGQSLSDSLTLGAAGALGFAKGGVFSGGVISAGMPVQPFAAGGVVASPTYFPTGGGLGLMGEAGPEAVMPLQRGSDGRLGVRGGATSGGGTTVHVNVQATDLASFKRSETQISAALARAVGRGRRAT